MQGDEFQRFRLIARCRSVLLVKKRAVALITAPALR